MVCIYCGNSTRVGNSRLQRQRNTVWRRRICGACGATFTTHETPAFAQGVLVRDATRRKVQPFSRDALFLSLYDVCKHRTNAIVDAGSLTDTITTLALKTLHEGAIERNIIAQIAHTVLQRFDSIAAELYAVYHPTTLTRAPKK